ncbi:unnamed protein product [Calypogeia fissa]
MNLFGKSPAQGPERLCQSNMQNGEVSPTFQKNGKFPTSSRVPAFHDRSPTSIENRRWNERSRNGSGESFLSSQKAGSSFKDPKHAEGGFSQTASKKRPGSELQNGIVKSNTMRHREPQSISAKIQQAKEELRLKRFGLVPRGVPNVSSTKQSDQTKSAETSRLPPQRFANKVAKTFVKNQRNFQCGLAQKDGRAGFIPPPAEQGRGTFQLPKKKIFNFPWEETMQMALKQGKALFLQNLDPWFSSAEIEANLQELLRVSCDVRMLPPQNFTCCTSGQALVLFRTQTAAEEALFKFTENLLIWSKDERPVVASLADAKVAVGNRIHGFYNAELSGSQGVLPAGEEQKWAVATSHCSQANTVEYEMGIQWRLLQDRHAEAWTIAAEDQKAAIDHPVHESKPKIP